jgi:hypothetical protein
MNDRDPLETVLGKPFAPELQDAVQKYRRNLLAASCLSLAITYAGIQVPKEAVFLGILRLDGLTPEKILIGLLLATTYMLVHFSLCCWDSEYEWMLRVSGARKLSLKRMMTHSHDDPNDVRQSTLANWWLERQPATLAALREELRNYDASSKALDSSMKLMEEQRLRAIDAAGRKLMDFDARINSYTKAEDDGHAELIRTGKEVAEQLRRESYITAESQQRLNGLFHTGQELMSTAITKLEDQNTILRDPRIAASLRRFDRTFEMALRLQNARWFFLECGLPIALGSGAVVALYFRLSALWAA